MDSLEIDAVLNQVVARLAEPAYKATYPDEMAFEIDVWPWIASLAQQLGFDCLTSHTVHSDRSIEKWQQFCESSDGPDVRALGANSRLDVVLKRDGVGSIGIEIKCLGKSGHTGKLTQGLGQAVLGLAKRDRTVLLIHCGADSVSETEREELRQLGAKICSGARVRLVVVP
jgi:hypothetical protein